MFLPAFYQWFPRPYYKAYQKAKNRDSYFRKHESEIILHGGAKHMLEQYGVSLKSLNLEKLKGYLDVEIEKNVKGKDIHLL